MGEFTIEIAEITFGVRSLFGSTQEYCRRYLTDREPEYSVTVSPEELVREQELWDLEADAEGLKHRKFTDPFLERAVIQRRVAEFSANRDVLLLHGSTVAVDGKAFLFTADCGVGKSTHTRFWRQEFGDRAVMVNDDRAFLMPSKDGVLAYGSPWSGKHGLDTNVCAMLAGICILERGTENQIRRLCPEEALPVLQTQVFLPAPGCRDPLYTLMNRIASTVPLWRMACTKDIQAAKMAFEAMSGKP